MLRRPLLPDFFRHKGTKRERGKRKGRFWGMWVLGLWVMVGCRSVVSAPPTPLGTGDAATAVTTNPTPSLQPTATPNPASWQRLEPGLEKRVLIITDVSGQVVERLKVVRIDQELYRFEVAYSPGEPNAIQTWLDELEATAVINGSFFTPEFIATGLTIVDGQPSGQSYGEFAGMVVIVDGWLEIRDLAQRPYDPNEPIEYAIQTFPILVSDGAQAYFEGGEADRRSMIGVDGDGRVLLIQSSLGGLSLAQMGQWLAESDLNLEIALNLDGGTSAALAIAGEEDNFGLLPIPNVIAVFPK